MDYQGIVLDIGATFEHITQAASGDLYLCLLYTSDAADE